MQNTNGPMTEAMYYVLLTLLNPNHGYQLMSAIETVSNGRIRMGPGTLYGVLARMQKEQLIYLCVDDGRRKTYRITDAGREALQAEYNRLNAMVADGIAIKEQDFTEKIKQGGESHDGSTTEKNT